MTEVTSPSGDEFVECIIPPYTPGTNRKIKTQTIANLGGAGGGVQSVTGDGVDNTDPDNPVLSFPSPSDIGLGNVNNTSDANKPVSTATQTALNAKEDIANQADVTIANGVTALNMAAGDIQFLTITEAKVINSITNSFIGTVGFVIPGTNSVTFTTINATVTGSYNSGEQNIIWVTCIDATGTPEYSITYENSLSSGEWGNITGNIIDQTDLRRELVGSLMYNFNNFI